jgi:hypothetical protein
MSRTQYIRIRRWPPDHAEEARKAGYYVEAIQTVHAWVETLLRDILLLSPQSGRLHKRGDFGKAWDVSNELSYTAAANAAFVAGLVERTTLDKLRAFNSVRNALIHKLLYEPYEFAYEGMPRRKYTTAFKLGIKLGYKLQRQVERSVAAPPN